MLPKFALISGLKKFKKSCKIMVVSEEFDKSRTVGHRAAVCQGFFFLLLTNYSQVGCEASNVGLPV